MVFFFVHHSTSIFSNKSVCGIKLIPQWKTAKFLGSFSLTHDIIAGIKIRDTAEAQFILANGTLCALSVLCDSLSHIAIYQQQ